jgi:NAD(P)-dependent dehydrogenase (short-subunit alcohol dehydrogenase family)
MTGRFNGLDVTSEHAWDALVAGLGDWPPIQVLINNAGIRWEQGCGRRDGSGHDRDAGGERRRRCSG